MLSKLIFTFCASMGFCLASEAKMDPKIQSQYATVIEQINSAVKISRVTELSTPPGPLTAKPTYRDLDPADMNTKLAWNFPSLFQFICGGTGDPVELVDYCLTNLHCSTHTRFNDDICYPMNYAAHAKNFGVCLRLIEFYCNEIKGELKDSYPLRAYVNVTNRLWQCVHSDFSGKGGKKNSYTDLVGCSPFQLAAVFGKVRVMRALYNALGAQVFINQTYSPSPLMLACSFNQTESVKYILRKFKKDPELSAEGALKNLREDRHVGPKKRTPFEDVLLRGKLELAKIFIKKKAVPDLKTVNYLLLAVLSFNPDLTRYIIELPEINVSVPEKRYIVFDLKGLGNAHDHTFSKGLGRAKGATWLSVLDGLRLWFCEELGQDNFLKTAQVLLVGLSNRGVDLEQKWPKEFCETFNNKELHEKLSEIINAALALQQQKKVIKND